MHHIRKSILDKLAQAASLRYGELKPYELDGNVFNYHLKGLIAERYVSKDDDANYALTPKGRDYIVHRYEDVAISAHSIVLIVVKRGGEYLLRRRDVQPLLGYTGFIHGEPRAGESIIETAQQRLFDKTGLSNVALSVVGSALISQYFGSELQSFSNAIVLYGETVEDMTVHKDATGHNTWARLEEVETLLPSSHDVLAMIEHKSGWFEQSYTLM